MSYSEKSFQYDKKMFGQGDSKKKAYENVSTRLGFMIKTLLQGSNAKLVPVNPSDIEDGVMVSPTIATSTGIVNLFHAVCLH